MLRTTSYLTLFRNLGHDCRGLFMAQLLLAIAARLILAICATNCYWLFVARLLLAAKICDVFHVGYMWHALIFAIRRIDNNAFINQSIINGW